MKRVVIFGKNYMIIEQRSDKDLVELKNNKIIVHSCKTSTSSLLKEFLTNLLYSQLDKIYEQIRKKGGIEVFGNIDFEIVEKIDSKRQRVAKLKGDKILVKLNAVALPKSVLKYVIAHEIAHIFIKRHTKKFWRTVELICPKFEKYERLLRRYEKYITHSE